MNDNSNWNNYLQKLSDEYEAFVAKLTKSGRKKYLGFIVLYIKVNTIMSKRFSNTTSDFIEWSDMLNLVRKLFDDKNYKMSLLIACGSFFGLRISDLLTLTWKQLLNNDYFELVEHKTGKKRIIKINPKLQKHIIMIV